MVEFLGGVGLGLNILGRGGVRVRGFRGFMGLGFGRSAVQSP